MRLFSLLCLVFVSLLVLSGCQAASGGSNSGQNSAPQNVQLTVQLSGAGAGTVTSSPQGIDCPSICSAGFNAGTKVTLTAAPSTGSSLRSWSGAGCSGNSSTCSLTLNQSVSVSATFGKADVTSLNHIIIMVQENRSMDSYFGELRKYWADNGYSDADFDGLPQFNPSPGPVPTNPGCDPAFPYPGNDCVVDSNSPSVPSYHLHTMCIENPSPSWNESHVDFNRKDPTSGDAKLDGFVHTAAHDGRNLGYFDSNGVRAMGYYTGDDLPYYYFMASNFATSDRWFSPVMSRTSLNRMYLLAATSQGHAYPLEVGSHQLTAKTIIELLEKHGISWKIYVHPGPDGCTTPQCLLHQSYIQNFVFGNSIPDQYPQNLVPVSQYLTDVQNATLPQVAMIEPASEMALDEHPSDTDTGPVDVQAGARYVASLVNALMTSSSWADSVFILTYDEGGGIYDHFAPQPTVSPDGIPPQDLRPGDICTNSGGATCDFTYTGFRVPLIVISPFAKKHYVSHTVADYTAILTLLEKRFDLPNLTARDAAQMDMTEFFDFAKIPWARPPSPPDQGTPSPCYLDHLP